MGDLEKQLKQRAQELKLLFRIGMKLVAKSCRKGWRKVKKIKLGNTRA